MVRRSRKPPTRKSRNLRSESVSLEKNIAFEDQQQPDDASLPASGPNVGQPARQAAPDDAQSQIAEWQARAESAERRSAEIKQVAESERQRSAFLNDAVEAALKHLQALEDEQTIFRSTLQAARVKAAAEDVALRSRLESAEAETRDLAARLEEASSFRKRVEDLQNSLTKVEAELFSKRHELSDLQLRHSRSRQKVAELEDEIRAALAAHQAATKETREQAQRADRLASTASDLAAEKAALTEEADKQRRRADAAELALAGITQRLQHDIRSLPPSAQEQSVDVLIVSALAAREQHSAALQTRILDYERRAARSEDARRHVERELSQSRAKAAETAQALWLEDVRWQVWQDSRAGRASLSLRRLKRRLSALRLSVSRAAPPTLFDTAYYLAFNPDVATSGTAAFRHYLEHGADEGRNPNALFDSTWYLKNNPDVAVRGANPLLHYVSTGAAELRDPHPDFSTRRYLESHPNLVRSGVNPLEHHLHAARLFWPQTGTE